MTTTDVKTIEEASADFNEAARLTPREAADKGVRYAQLHNAPRVVFEDRRAPDMLRRVLAQNGGYIDVDGIGRVHLELPEAKDLEREEKRLSDELKGWLAGDDDGALFVEGVGELRLQPRSNVRYDVDSIYANAPELFDELRERGALQVNKTVVDAQVKTGHLQGVNRQGFRIEGAGAPALIIDERAARR